MNTDWVDTLDKRLDDITGDDHCGGVTIDDTDIPPTICVLFFDGNERRSWRFKLDDGQRAKAKAESVIEGLVRKFAKGRAA